MWGIIPTKIKVDFKCIVIATGRTIFLFIDLNKNLEEAGFDVLGLSTI